MAQPGDCEVLQGSCNRSGRDCAACPPAKGKARELLGSHAYEVSCAGPKLIFRQKSPEDITFVDSILSLVGGSTFQGQVVIVGGKIEQTRL